MGFHIERVGGDTVQRRSLGLILTLALVLNALLGSAVFAAGLNAQGNKPEAAPNLAQIGAAAQAARNNWLSNKTPDSIAKASKFAGAGNRAGGEFPVVPPYGPTDLVRVIVEVNATPAAERIAAGGRSLASLSAHEVESARRQTLTQVASVAAAATKMGVTMRHQYGLVLAGFSADVRYSDVERLKNLPGVKNVALANRHLPENKNSVPLIGATSEWRTATGLDGTGTVIAIVDTGIDYRHETFGSQAGLDPQGKVIAGWNFADANSNVIPTPESSVHGTHVAATAAGMGYPGSHEYAGVAPGAKLIAEKVFSNDPDNPYAYTDDIVAGLEDAIRDTQGDASLPAQRQHPKADVINMSLGSTSGFNDPTDPEQVAIERAVKAGVVLSVSAGNSSYSTSGIYYPYYRFQDIAAVGSPSVAPDTISVAASQNAAIYVDGSYFKTVTAMDSQGVAVDLSSVQDRLVYNDSGSPVRPSSLGDQEYDVVQVSNYGCDASDVPAAVAGKVALISRGGCTFATKIDNAAAKGAVAVIVYNNQSDGNGIFTMGGTEGVTIPAVMTFNSAGAKLAKELNDGGSVKINFAGQIAHLEVPTSEVDTLSNFSSWGTAPDLTPKPDVTAPGGNIRSATVPNQYEAWNGTSMAAPHVTGAAALLKQAHSAWTPKEIKVALQNTSKILMQGSVPYSIRQQGAGRIQVDQAAATPVLAFAESGKGQGTGQLALGQVAEQSRTGFAFTLKNDSAEPVTYTLSATPVYRPKASKSGTFFALSDEPWTGASVVLGSDTVTVPAGGETRVTGLLDLTGAAINPNAPWGHWAEAFVQLTAAGQPALHLPLLAFAGEFDQMPIVDRAMDDPWAYMGRTGLYVPYGGGHFGGLGWSLDGSSYDPQTVAISPNHDGNQDSAYPLVELLRNSPAMTIDVKDASGQVVRRIGNSQWLRNIGVGYYLGDWSWDGTRYDRRFGRNVPAPDGQYQVEIRTKSAAGNTWQTYDLPVKVDTTLPEVQITSAAPQGGEAPYSLTWQGADAGSGVWAYAIVLDGAFVDVGGPAGIFLPGDTTSYDLDLSAITSGEHSIAVIALDNADNVNVGGLSFGVSDQALQISSELFWTPDVAGLMVPVLRGDVAKVSYVLDGGAPTTVTPAAGSVEISLPGLTEGDHLLAVDALNAADAVLATYSVLIHVDGTAPKLTLDYPSGVRSIEGDKTVFVSGSVADASPVTVFVNGSYAEVDEWGDFITTATFEADGRQQVVVTVQDAAGNTTEISRAVYLDTAAPVLNLFGITSDTFDYTGDQFHLQGTVSDAISPYNLTVNGDVVYQESRMGDETQPYALDMTLPLEDGVNLINIEATDIVGHKAARQLKITKKPAVLTGLEVTPSVFSPMKAKAIIKVTTAAAGWLTVSLTDANGQNLRTLYDGRRTAGAYSLYWDGRAADRSIVDDGTYTVVAEVRDGGRLTAPVVTDRTPPASVALVSPAAGGMTSLSFQAVATADGAGEVTLIAVGMGKTLKLPMTNDSDPATYQAAVELTKDGTYFLSVEAVDAAGNVAVSPKTVVSVDGTAPTLRVTAPAAAVTKLKTATLTLAGVASEKLSALKVYITRDDGVEVESASATVTLRGTSWKVQINAQAEADALGLDVSGSYKVRLVGVDTVGHESAEAGQAVRTFAVDQAPPVVTVAAEVNGVLTVPLSQKSNYTLSFIVEDLLSGVKAGTVKVLVNGRYYYGRSSNTEYEVKLTNLKAGNQIVKIMAIDGAGNTVIHQFTISVVAP